MKSRRKNDKGFSLIELIIAVAILVVLSGLLAPQLIKYVERSRESKDMQMLDSVYVAVNTALTDEKAYEAFLSDAAANGYAKDIDKGVVATTLVKSDGDAFQKEVASILGVDVKKLELTSKRAKGTDGKIYVQVQSKTTKTDGVEGLEVGVYAGTGPEVATDSTFIIGSSTATPTKEPESK